MAIVTDIGDLDEVAEELRQAVPRIARAVAAAENDAVALMGAAGKEEAAKLKEAIHDRSGTLDRSIGIRVRRLPGGGVMLSYGSVKQQTFATRKAGAGPRKQDVFYAYFVDQGTGVYGPKGTRIAKPGLVRMGNEAFRPSGKGQKPQKMFQESAERFYRNSLALDAAIDRRLTLRIESTV